MAQFQCDICHEFLDIDLFRFSRNCGHGLCLNCLQGFFGGDRELQPCPTCRKPFSIQDVHRIYLNCRSAGAPSPSVSSTPSRSGTGDANEEVKAAMKRIQRVSTVISNRNMDTPEQTVREVRHDIVHLIEQQPKEPRFKVRTTIGSFKMMIHRFLRSPFIDESLVVQATNLVLSAFKTFLNRLVPVMAQAKDDQKRLRTVKKDLKCRNVERDRLVVELKNVKKETSRALEAARLAQAALKAVKKSEVSYRIKLASTSEEVRKLRTMLSAHNSR